MSQGTGNTLGLDSLTLSADDSVINSANTTFTVSSAIDLGSYNLSVNPVSYSSTVEFDGVISGAGGLNFGGSGQSILNAANLYTGVTTVNSGTLVVENDAGLGTAAMARHQRRAQRHAGTGEQ